VGPRRRPGTESQGGEVPGSGLREPEGRERPGPAAVRGPLVPLLRVVSGIQRARPGDRQDRRSPLDEAPGEKWKGGVSNFIENLLYFCV